MADQIAYCKIHPAIGIARVGNSPQGYFIGPEIPGVRETPVGGYKDNGDPKRGVPPRIKRQAARFRVYAYDAADKPIREITLDDAEISWTVHLINSKAEGDRFAGRAGEGLPIGERRPRQVWRNRDIDDRDSLIIDPGPRTVAGPEQLVEFNGGKFRGKDVPLGDLRTDAQGRLVVLGGFGKTEASNPSQRITDYANNDLWHDDVSDGPVTAHVRLKSGQEIEVRPAWVIVAPPDFAPAVPNVVTLYDVAVDTALRNGLGDVPDAPGDRPSFTRDVAPILDRLVTLEWVQQGARGAGPGVKEFADLAALAKASDATRRRIVGRFRNPTLDLTSQEAIDQANSDFLPALSGDSGDASPGKPERWLAVTRTQYAVLMKWQEGQFVDDWTGSFPEPRREVTPEGLDRAALEACTGGAFYPGIEGGWLLRNPQAYASPFRLSHDVLRPGYVTRHMACPWQADFYECAWHWWPAQRPDEVLTIEAYRRIREIEELLEDGNASEADRERLATEKQQLMQERSSWTRGLPTQSYEGDMAMIERWAQHGFIVDTDQDGEPFSLDGRPTMVETERGRYDAMSWPEYFHILTNIEQHPGFLPKAKELAHSFFAEANYEADAAYRPFPYSPEALDARLKSIYDAYVEALETESRMDTGLIQWPVVVGFDGDREVTKLKTFDVKPFSNRAVKERLRQRAPFNLVDGAWLQRIQAAGPVDEIRSNLFAIWDDEAGNGRTGQNHCNVYDTLLRSLSIYMPPITARKFIEQDLLPAAFIQPVFQLVVGLFPDDFYPELLGMTLYLEWEASPTMTPVVRHYRRRGIDPQFYALHVAIDNITAGHGHLAKEAIKLYLQKVEDEGGAKAVQDAWGRIWCGYVTWATAGDLGRDLLELCMIIDHKQIDLSYPDMLTATHVKGSEIIGRLKVALKGDAAADPLSVYLSKRFMQPAQDVVRNASDDGAPPPRSLVAVVVDELNRLIQGQESFYAETRFKGVKLGDDTLALIRKGVKGEELVRLNRLLLRDGYVGIVSDLPRLEPLLFPDYRAHFESKFVQLIKRKTYAAKPLHRRVVIGQENLAGLFDDPERLVKILATSDLINIKHPRSSRFFEATSFTGPMYKIFTEAEVSVILDWIESLQEKHLPPEPLPGPTPQEAAAKMLRLLESNAAASGAVSKHADYQVAGHSLKEWFRDPPGLMAAFAGDRSWVVPGDGRGSRLYEEFESGRMSSVMRAQAPLIKQWIDSGAVLVAQEAASAIADVAQAPGDLRLHEATFVPDPETVPPATVAVAPAIQPIGTDFAAKRKLIGMGSVH